jgi:hypothetical protein
VRIDSLIPVFGSSCRVAGLAISLAASASLATAAPNRSADSGAPLVSGWPDLEAALSLEGAAERSQRGGAGLVRGPYLQSASPTGIVVRWRTSSPTQTIVLYGVTPGLPQHAAWDAAPKTEHTVSLAGLTPGTRYYYSIETFTERLAGGDALHYFDTHPLPGTTGKVRVWVIGDSGTANLSAALVRFSYLAQPGSSDTDVWLMLGDNAYDDGTDAEYQDAVFEMYPSVLRNTVLWPTRGNHDGPQYYNIFTLPTAGQCGGIPSGTEAYYSFDYANVHFICLDSEGSNRSPGSPMLTWLEQDLAANMQDWILAYWHHPPYTKGSHDSDSDSQLADMRENALPILEAGGVDLVMCGHSHSYERSCLIDGHYGQSSSFNSSMVVDGGDGDPGGDGPYRKPEASPVANAGTVYNVTGSSGKTGGGDLDHPVMVFCRNVLGSLFLDIDGDRLDARFIETSGIATDRFTIIKGAGTGIGGPGVAPSAFGILQSDPNPFASDTSIHFAVPGEGVARMLVYDLSGRLVRELLDATLPAGRHRRSWDGRNAEGSSVAPGVYFAVLEFGGEARTKKLVRVH